MTRVRKAKPADLDRLVEIENANFDGDRIAAAEFARLIASPRARVLVEEAGALRGMAVLTFRTAARSVKLYSLVTDSAHRGAGVATALMDAAERWAQRVGFARLTLEVRQDNASAIRFYEKRGYRRYGRIDGYYEDGHPAWRYAKELRTLAR